jgi:GNAT superfamily N-acetyltransferase
MVEPNARPCPPTALARDSVEFQRMLTYRTFRNIDPPALAALWRSRAGQHGLLQPVTPDALEQLVFSRLYFEHGGLVLAFDEDQAVGFAHAGFGPNPQQSWTSCETGVICMLLVRPGCDDAQVSGGLMDRCEEYLRDRGAKAIYGGGLHPLSPFYLGMYGGSELPGVLDCDTVARQAFATHGYQEIERTVLLGRDLSGFESPIDRRQMQVRRQMVVEVTSDAPTRTWWEASTLGEFELTQFDAVPRVGGSPAATALFRSMEPSGTTAVGRATGLIELSVQEPYRRRGVAVFLLSEAFRQFLRQGIRHVSVQTSQSNVAALAMFQKLGFQPDEAGGLWKKDG